MLETFALTSDPKENLRFSKPTTRLIGIVQHFEHRAHLFPAIQRVVFNNDDFILLHPLNPGNLVSRIRGVRCHDKEAKSILV